MTPIITIFIDVKLIAGSAPIAGKSCFRCTLRVPITKGRRIPFDFQRAHFAGWYLMVICIDNFSFVTLDDAAQAAWFYVFGPIRNVNMKHLCRTDAIANLNTEHFLPAMIKLDWQGFAC